MDVRLQFRDASGTTIYVDPDQPLPVDIGGGLTGIQANQGDPNTATNAWPVKLTDGTEIADVTAANALKVDGSAVTQPVSASALPLPSGASTSALQTSGNTSLSSIDTKTPALVTGRVPVDGSGVTQPVSGSVSVSGTVSASQSGTWNLTNISGTVSLPTGASTESTLSTLNGKVPSNLTVTATRLLVDGSGVTQPVSGTLAATQSGTWTVQPGNTANTTAWLVTSDKSSTSSVTSVAGATSSTSLLASNASRKNATFFNDSSSLLYLKLGATASTSSYTVQVPANGYYELPTGRVYTGAIDGIWASATGNVRITELS